MGDGNKRPRKRNPRPKKAERLRMAAEAARQEEEGDDYSDDSYGEQPDDRPGMSRRRTYDDDDDVNIDPELRHSGHMVNEGRAPVSASSAARRSARRGHSPYSTPSPTGQQSSRTNRSYPSSSSQAVPTMTPVTSWNSNRPSSRGSDHSSYDPPPPPQPGYGQTTFSSTRSTLHPSRDSAPPPPHRPSVPSTSKAAPSNWAPYGSWSSLSTSTVPSISATTRLPYTHTPQSQQPQALTSLSGSTRTYVSTHSYTSNTRATSGHDYDSRYARPQYSSSRSVDSREPSDPPRRPTTSLNLNRQPDWDNAAVPRRQVYENYSESSDDSEEEE